MTAKVVSLDEKTRLVDEIRQRAIRLMDLSMTLEDSELFKAAGHSLVPLNTYVKFGTTKPSHAQILESLRPKNDDSMEAVLSCLSAIKVVSDARLNGVDNRDLEPRLNKIITDALATAESMLAGNKSSEEARHDQG